MDFTPDETTAEVTRLASDIAAKLSGPGRVAQLADTGAPIDDALWRELAQAGLLGLELAESAGGGGLTVLDTVAVAEQLGRALAVVPYGQHAIAALPTLVAHGSAGLQSAWTERLAGGDAVAVVAIDEDLVYQPTAPTTALRPNGANWELTGTKVVVAFASAADVFLVTATGPQGPVVVAVPADAAGVSITPTLSTGLLPVAQVEFTAVELSEDAVLSGGAATVEEFVSRAALAVCAEQCGIVDEALRLTAVYAAEREQFDKPIGANQAVAQRLADGYIDVQGLKLTTVQAAWQMAHDDSTQRVDVATAKFWAAQAGHRVAHTAVHVHGGVGLDTTHPVHRYFLRAKHNEYANGALPATLALIGAALAAQPA